MIEKEHEEMVRKDEELPTAEKELERKNEEVPKMKEEALEEKVNAVTLPNRMYVYLTRKKPKTKMNDIQRTGTKFHLPCLEWIRRNWVTWVAWKLSGVT